MLALKPHAPVSTIPNKSIIISQYYEGRDGETGSINHDNTHTIIIVTFLVVDQVVQFRSEGYNSLNCM